MAAMPGFSIGRERELQWLCARLDAACRGEAGLVRIVGEPGVGKTHLAELARTQARSRGMRIGSAHAWEGAPPFGLLVEALRRAHTDASSLTQSLGRHAAVLRELFPEAAGEKTSAVSPAQRLEALGAWLASAPPSLLLLDDLHDADLESLETLAWLAPRLRSTHLLVLATERSVGARATDEARAALSRIGRASEVLELGGLSVEAIAQWMETVTAGSVVLEQARALEARTRGNALFIDAILRAGTLNEAALLPSDVRDVVRQHIDAAGGHAHALLLSAALLERPFTAQLLAQAHGLQTIEVDEALASARAHALIIPAAPAGYALRHPLFGEVLRTQGSARERAERHAQLAQAIAAFEGPAASSSELARHWIGAVAVAGAQPALAACERAAQHAIRIRAHGEAVRIRRAMWALVEEHGGDARTRAHVLVELGSSLLAHGKRAEAREALDRAWEVADTLGDAPLLEACALATADTGEFGRLDRVKHQRLQVAIDLTHDERTRVRLTARLAAELWTDPERSHDREALSARALELARTIDDGALRVVALDARFAALVGPAHRTERRVLAAELSARAAASGSADDRLTACRRNLLLALEDGDLAGCDVAIAGIAELATELQREGLQEDVLQRRTMLAVVRGDLDAAIELAEETRRIALAQQNPQADMGFRFLRGEVALARGEQALLIDFARAHRSDIVRLPHLSFLPARVAQLAAHAGDTRDAQLALDAYVVGFLPRLREEITKVPGLVFAADAAAVLGDVHAARLLLDELAPYCDRFATVGSTICLGHAALFVGILAGLLGEHGRAFKALDLAHAEHTRVRSPVFARRSALALARALRQRGDAADLERAALLEGEAAQLATLLGVAADAAAASTAQAPSISAVRAATLTCEGASWRLLWEGRESRVRDAKGMRLIATLLVRARDELHVLDLMGAGELRSRSSEARLDAPALAQYRARIRALRAEISEAHVGQDAATTDASRAELERLEDELAAAVGLGGRARGTGNSERARVAVAKSIARALALIEVADPAAAAHLKRSLRLGAFCSYDPEGEVSWTIGPIVTM